ncbi:hypothetical protein AWN76_013480 [Rhodothermaceae bacterium RA]|nr:hypothetical protein AWN76_013480 [Rhodothermaceae bacterium RA]
MKGTPASANIIRRRRDVVHGRAGTVIDIEQPFVEPALLGRIGCLDYRPYGGRTCRSSIPLPPVSPMRTLIEFHYIGGPIFMVPMSVLALTLIALILRKSLDLFVNPTEPLTSLRRGLDAIVQIGGFAFIWGLLGQALALYEAFQAIEAMGGVSPAVLAGGLKVSMIVPIYGLLLFAVSGLAWFVLKQRYLSLEAARDA